MFCKINKQNLPKKRREFIFPFPPISKKVKYYTTNLIHTSKYNFLTFLPKSLLIQFQRFANIYFLKIAVLQSIKLISPLNPFTAVGPLLFVLGLSIMREGIEDYLRHKSDNQVNSLNCLVLENSSDKEPKFVLKQWKELEVGNIIKVLRNENFPADLILMTCEEVQAYVQTSSLDGEKNLKSKRPLNVTRNFFNENFLLKEKNLERYLISTEDPNPLLYRFEGSIEINNKKHVLDSNQFLLRGASLKNTKFIIGIVAFTGKDTKLMKNSEAVKFKMSNVEKKLNTFVIGVLILQFLICLLLAILNGSFNSVNDKVYLGESEYSIFFEALLSYFTYYILLNTMLPISLVVTLEFVKIFQAYFVSCDEDLFRNKHFCRVVTSSINEELGQIQHILTDKTGTLTCNKMELVGFALRNYNLDFFNIFDSNSENYNNFEKVNSKQDINITKINNNNNHINF